MKNIKIRTITISVPENMNKEIQDIAKLEHRTVSELIRETFRQYKALKNFKELSAQGKSTVKRKKLTSKDFGGSY